MNNMLPTPASEDVPLSSSSSVTAHDSAAPATNTTRAPISAPETAHLSRTSSNATRAEYTSTTMPKTFTPIKTNEESNAITSKVEGGASASAKEPELIKSNSNNKPNFNKGSAFWMIMLSLAMSMFLSALDLTALSTALPRIATDLESENFTWIGSAYALASTAFLPVFGGVAAGFGRKPVLLAAILIFAVGSAVCGSANTMEQMIAGRTVQGVGGGGILAMSEIVVADLVPLAERGVFLGLLGLVWAISSAIGPVMGGALASNWRWLFYLNLPISGVAFGLVLFFMNLKLPSGTLMQKLAKLDWFGNLLFVTSSTAIILGLTWGGDAYAWDTAAVLVPLIVGCALMAFFFFYEKVYAKHPIVPFELLSNRNSLSGYATTFLHGLVSIAVIYYLPAWFQGVLGHSPVRTGVDLFPTAFLIAPMAIATGISVTITQKFVIQNWIAWIFCIVGSGLLVILNAGSSESAAHGLQVIVAIGLGILYAAVNFPVLAPLPPSLNAEAMSFLAFARSFGQVFGIVIGSTTLSNQLRNRLPAEFLSSLPGGPGLAYSHITEIANIPEPLRTQVRIGFSDSIRYIWIVMIAFSALGLVFSLFQKTMPLNATTDEAWGLADKGSAHDSEREKSPETIV